MKKYIAFLLLVFVLFVAKAQKPAECVFVLNGKEFGAGSKISKDDLLKFCKLQIKDGTTGKVITAVSVSWVISHKGLVFKGTNPIDCSKIAQAVNQMTSGDVIFFEGVRFRDTAGLCVGQYILTLE